MNSNKVLLTVFLFFLIGFLIYIFWIQNRAVAAWWEVNSLVVLQSLVSGILMGGIYGLVAIGLTLIFGVLKIINFAHGTLMTVGMYTTLWTFNLYGIDPYISLLITIPLLFLVGIFIQKVVIRPVMDSPMYNQLLLTMGLSLFIMNLF